MAYFTMVTETGAAKVAAAIAAGTTVSITHLAVGDGGGGAEPDGTETALVNEVWRGSVSDMVSDGPQLTVSAGIPAATGGFTIREVGMFDTDGDLIAVCNYPDTYKPSSSEGGLTDILIRMVVIFEVNIDGVINIVIDPSAVYATVEYVDDTTADAITAHVGADDPHPDKLDADAQAVDSAGLEGNSWADVGTAIATAIADLVDSSPATLDTLNELAAALGDDPNFATTMTNMIALKLDITTFNNHSGDTSNPHGVTAAQVGALATGDVQAAIDDLFHHDWGTPPCTANSNSTFTNGWAAHSSYPFVMRWVGSSSLYGTSGKRTLQMAGILDPSSAVDDYVVPLGSGVSGEPVTNYYFPVYAASSGSWAVGLVYRSSTGIYLRILNFSTSETYHICANIPFVEE